MFSLPTKRFINAIFVGITNMNLKEDLIENIKSFLSSAELVYKKGDYTSASILFFKSLFAVLDLIILKKSGKTPKDHSERFRLLQNEFPELYEILDKLYPVYRETYTLKIEKDVCDKIKENVDSITKKYKIFG